MKNITFGLLVATMLTSAATGAYANSDTFKAINPNPGTPANTIKNGQKGTNNVITGRVIGSGNAFALTQVGVSNHTSVNANVLTNSNVRSAIKGNGNSVDLNMNIPVSQENTPNNLAIDTSVKGDDNGVRIGVQGRNSSVALKVSGVSNDVSFNVNGRASSNTTIVTGNNNRVWGWEKDPLSGSEIVANVVKTTVIGNHNDVNFADNINHLTLTSLAKGDNNEIHYSLSGAFNTVNLSQAGNGGSFYVGESFRGRTSHSNVTVSSHGDDNYIALVNDHASTYDTFNAFVNGSQNMVSVGWNGSELNTVSQTITGSSNTVRVSQGDALCASCDPGVFRSTISQTITGSNNLLDVQQDGGTYDSKFIATISGDNNVLAANSDTVVTRNFEQWGHADSIALVVTGDYNTSGFSQWGDNHALNLKINGNANVATGGQSGSENTLNLKINGNANYVDIDQDGGEQTMIASITGNSNDLFAAQYSDTNENILNAKIMGSGNRIDATQGGNHPEANLSIKGNADSILVSQMGDTNTLTASIADGGASREGNNIITAYQTGNANNMKLAINGGADDTLNGVQTGNSNIMAVTFTGSGNTGDFSQTGNGLKYSLNSNLSNKTFKVDQHN